jgi:hypothetical protein
LQNLVGEGTAGGWVAVTIEEGSCPVFALLVREAMEGGMLVVTAKP